MTYGDVKCGGFNKLVGVDSECDSWVLETIHGVASGSATIIWSKRRERDDPCPCSAESGITRRAKDVMLLR